LFNPLDIIQLKGKKILPSYALKFEKIWINPFQRNACSFE
jgi:hypothetical protein